jgi:hypothetical protein
LLLELPSGVFNSALILALPAAILGLSRLHAYSPCVALRAGKNQIYLPWSFDDKIESSSKLLNSSLDGFMDLEAVSTELTT